MKETDRPAGRIDLGEALEQNREEMEESNWYQAETGDRPKWTDPTTCPECGTRGGEIWIEWHLSDAHDWCLIERHFGTESLVEPRDVDGGEQSTLGDMA